MFFYIFFIVRYTQRALDFYLFLYEIPVSLGALCGNIGEKALSSLN